MAETPDFPPVAVAAHALLMGGSLARLLADLKNRDRTRSELGPVALVAVVVSGSVHHSVVVVWR